MSSPESSPFPIDAAPGALAWIDPSGRIGRVSVRFAALLGRREDELVDTALADWVAPEDRTSLLDALGADDVAELCVSGGRGDGLPFVATLTIGPRGDRGRLVGLASRGAPIRSATDLAPDPGDGRTVVDSAVSHDVRGALRGVSGFLSLLDRDADTLPEQLQGFLDTARRSAATADRMAEQLVLYLRLAQRPLVVAPVGLADVVAEAADRELQRAGDDTPNIDAGELPVVIGNRVLLVELFAELLCNASKFGSRVVTIGARRAEGWTYVTVEDDGPGIDADLAEQAFTLFRLLQPKGRYPGVGAGLAIARRTAEVHGGAMWIEPSERGTRVVVRLLDAGVQNVSAG